MESKNFGPDCPDSVCQKTSDKQRLGLFNNAYRQRKVRIQEVNRMGKGGDVIGQFYRIEKSFFYKERIMALYLMGFLFQNWGSSVQNTRNQCRQISNIFYESIKEFEINKSKGCELRVFLLERKLELAKLEQIKNKLVRMIEIIILVGEVGNMMLKDEQIVVFLDMMVNRWCKNERIGTRLFEEIEGIFGEEMILQQVYRENRITQLGVIRMDMDQERSQKHLLYKNIVLRIGSSTIVKIIQTNHQKYVFFQMLFQPDQVRGQTKSKISDLFQQKHRRQIFQSQGQNSQSDNQSQIVRDDQFYRISSKISTSIRKNSFYQGELNIDGRDLYDNNILFNSNIPTLTNQYKIHNPLSQIYTRSSSLQKGTFPFRDNLSTSIDLLMRMQLQTQKKRKKSCQNARTYHKSVQKEQEKTLRQKMSFKFKINLYNEEKANLYCANFDYSKFDDNRNEFVEGGKQLLLGNQRLGIARSFFRQNQQQQKD